MVTRQSAPGIMTLIFGQGIVHLGLCIVYGVLGTTFLVLLVIGPRERRDLVNTAGRLLLCQYLVLLLWYILQYCRAYACLCGRPTPSQAAMDLFDFQLRPFAFCTLYFPVGLIVARLRYGRWPRYTAGDIGALLAGLLSLFAISTGYLLLQSGAMTEAIWQDGFVNLDRICSPLPTATNFQSILAVALSLSIFGLLAVCALNPTPTRRSLATWLLRAQLALLVTYCLLWYWPAVDVAACVDPALGGWLPWQCFVAGLVVLAACYGLARLRFREWSPHTMLGIASTVCCVMAFPLATLFRLFCQEPYCWL